MKSFYLFFFILLSETSSAKYLFAPSTFFYGNIYSKNSWANTADFITNGNSSVSLSGNYINISSSNTYDWSNIIYVTNYQTKLEKWNFKARFKIEAWASNSYGIGFGLKSANPAIKNDVMGFIQTANTGTGGLYIVKSDQSVLNTGSTPLGVALYDIIEVEGNFYDSIFTFKATNITSGNVAMVSYTYACNGSTHAVPNTSYFSILELGGTHQLQNIEITSNELSGANIVTIGDSKTIGYFTNTFTGRYAAQLNKAYPAAVINAGGGDRITQVLNRVTELQRLAPSRYLLSIGSNDLRFGGSLDQLKTDYISLVNILRTSGAQVYHMVLPEDYSKSLAVQGTGLIDFKNWVAATYPGYYINVWDSLSTSNYLKGMYDTGDGVHLNQLANDKIYEAIVASNKLSGGSLPVTLYSFEVNRTNDKNAVISWRTPPTREVNGFTIEKSTEGRRFTELVNIRANDAGRYVYTDNTLTPGNNYYRLKMQEISGAITFSKTILLTNNINSSLIINWHGLIGEDIMIKIYAASAINIGWQLFDITGRRINAGKQKLRVGNNTIPILTEILPKGLYYFVVTGPGNEKLSTVSVLK